MPDDPSAKKRMTIREVAEASGTSISTVSRVLTGSASVSPAKSEAVLKAIDALDYSPNLLARGLKTRLTYSLGLIISDIQSPFYAAAAKGIQEYAGSKGYSLLLCDTGQDPHMERQYLEMLRAKDVDGIIFVPSGENQDYVCKLIEEGARLVQIDRSLDDVPASAVLVDDEHAAYNAVRHLIANGYRRIAILFFSERASTHRLRLQGYRRAMHEADLPVPQAYVRPSVNGGKKGIGTTLSLFDLTDPPEALFATSSRLGISVLQALRERNLQVQNDIGIVVFDDIEAFSLMSPTVTAIHQPGYDIGWTAAEMLVDAVESGQPLEPRQVVLPTRLIIRESSHPRIESINLNKV